MVTPLLVVEPRVDEDVGGGQPLLRLSPQEIPNQALGPRGKAVRHHKVTPADLQEKVRVFRVVERIPSN